MEHTIFETLSGSTYWATPGCEDNTLIIRQLSGGSERRGICYGEIKEGRPVRFWDRDGKYVDTSIVIAKETA